MLTDPRTDPTPPEHKDSDIGHPNAAVGARVIIASGVVLTVVMAISFSTYLSGVSYDVLTGSFLGIALFFSTLPPISRQARREGDSRLFWLLFIALLVHFLVAGFFAHYVAFHVPSDAKGFHKEGIALATSFRAGDFSLHSLRGGPFGTNFPVLLNGILYAVIGPTSYGAFFFYTWLGFWGLLYFYRAFILAVPEGRGRSYARLIFFLPSQTFWSSYMGKEAWMVFGLGIAVYGAARVLSGSTWRGLILASLGMGLMAFVRPHVAGLVAIALAFGFILRRPRKELRQLAPISKGIGLVIVALVALFFIHRAEQFLKQSGIDTSQGLTTALQQSSQGAAYGGSRFTPSIVTGPKELPSAILTVLFRPLITQRGSLLQTVASIEGTFLLILSIFRIRSIWAAVRSIRRQPFVAFALAYVGMFIIAFSGFANFGLLDRERVQLLPLYAVLLSLPPKRKWLLRPSESESPTSLQSI